MSLFAAFVRMLCRWLPPDERRDLAFELREIDTGAEPAVGSETAGGGAVGPDWDYLWTTLIEASSLAGRIEDLLADKRAFFDISDTTKLAKQLRTQVNDAYELMCVVPRHEGLDFEAGDDLATARRLVDIRRAEILDAELSALHLPASDAPTWVVEYRDHGGFIATTAPTDAHAADGASPWKFWGYAPTAHAAAHALSWYFVDNPPAIVFEPPLPTRPRPWVPSSWDADLSREGPSARDLLERRGPVYEEHLAACRAAREILRRQGDVEIYLAQRAAELNTTDPQLRDSDALTPFDSANPDHRGSVDTAHWVPTNLVVSTDFPTWGDFEGHRNHSPLDIVNGLLTTNHEAFTTRLFGHGIMLIRVPGWAGPLYTVGNGGNHRIHTARMLNLPYLAADISTQAPPLSTTISHLVFHDKSPEDRRLPHETREHDRTALIEGMIRRGIIDGELTHDDHQTTLHCRKLPATWLLRAPHRATTVNTIYESRYPAALEQLGIPTSIGTDPDAWVRWLTT